MLQRYFSVTAVPVSRLLIFLLENQVVERIAGLLIAFGKHMAVDVERGADLRMAEPLADRQNVDTLGNQKAGLRVTELMRMDRRQVMALGEFRKPIGGRVRMHRLPIVRGHDVAGGRMVAWGI